MGTSRELVRRALDFDRPSRVPRQLWTLPWAVERYARDIEAIRKRYPEDLIAAPEALKQPPMVVGNRFEPGEHVDPWGCRFTTIERGLAGEVKEPVITGDDWNGLDAMRVPEELLTIDRDEVSLFCRATDGFVLAPSFIGPFERLQYLRGTQQLLLDIGLGRLELETALARVHEFFCRYVDAWTRTAVDAVWMLDDWGAQRGLLIHPVAWVRLFRPLYREYAAIAHANGKKFFMHSDGHILDIVPHLVDIGIDALNAQLACMGVENLRRFRGSITFWGEMDRQWLLPHGTQADIRCAVAAVKENLWDRGGCIAQCEFGVGARPENVLAVYQSWDELGA